MAAMALQAIAAKRATGLRRPGAESASLRDLEPAVIAAAALTVAATQSVGMEASDWVAHVILLHHRELLRPEDSVVRHLRRPPPLLHGNLPLGAEVRGELGPPPAPTSVYLQREQDVRGGDGMRRWVVK